MGEMELWLKMQTATERIVALLRDPHQGLFSWLSLLDRAKRDASEAAMELGLPYIGLGHYQKTDAEGE